MIRFIYNLLWPLGLLFFLPGYLIKMFRRGGYRRKPAPGGAKIDLVARGQCWRSWCRTKTRGRAAPPPARSALRFDDYYHDWLFLRRQQRGRLDRGHVQPARFLANHAPGVFDYPAGPDRSDRG